MARLSDNRWGKSEVRVSKLLAGADQDEFLDVTAQILLRGDVEAAYLQGDNSGVVPTDTMRNTVYGLAQEHLTGDLESFALVLASHHAGRPGIEEAMVELSGQRWQRHSPTGFLGGSPEHRLARVTVGGGNESTEAGIEGLVVLKTSGSAFAGFPRDDYTILPETDDRILATTISAKWRYQEVPTDTTATWEQIRTTMLDHFFTDRSQSAQHQGWMMAEALLDTIPEITTIDFRLPNQHHLPYDLTRFGLEDAGIVFHPVPEPYGDIRFTASRKL